MRVLNCLLIKTVNVTSLLEQPRRGEMILADLYEYKSKPRRGEMILAIRIQIETPKG